MRVISPQELLRRALADPLVGRGRDAGDRVPHQHPGDRRGQARPHPGRTRDLAREEARRPRRPPAPGRCSSSSTRAGPSPAPRRAQPPRRARRPDRGRQGHRRRADQGAPPRDPPVGVGDHAPAAAGRDRGRALLLRRRRRVRPARHGRRAARARHGAQPVPLRHAATADRRGAGAPAARCCSRSICRARARSASAEPSATLVFLLPPSWDELVHRLVGRGTEGAEERARRLRTAKVELASQNEFDFRVVNEDVASAAREVVELVKAPAR